MLSIKNLYASVVDGEQILKGVNLEIGKGEIHAIMGPNGSGKSTLANVLAGKPSYKIDDGDVLLSGESIVGCTPDERAHKGMFLAFQYPLEVVGVRQWQFLKAAIDAKNEVKGLPKTKVREFNKIFDSAIEKVKIDKTLTKRSLNEGYSGGEKKRNEILQMLILEPLLVILDETDSGLDVDALRVVSDCVNGARTDERSFLIITHYHRILEHIVPDAVHVLKDGKVIKSGDAQLAKLIEDVGYDAACNSL